MNIKSTDPHPRTDRRGKGKIVKMKNPDRRRFGGKKYLYFESQRDLIDFTIEMGKYHEDLDLKYECVEATLSVRLDTYEEFAGYEVKRHHGSGSTLRFQYPKATLH